MARSAAKERLVNIGASFKGLEPSSFYAYVAGYLASDEADRVDKSLSAIEVEGCLWRGYRLARGGR